MLIKRSWGLGITFFLLTGRKCSTWLFKMWFSCWRPAIWVLCLSKAVPTFLNSSLAVVPSCSFLEILMRAVRTSNERYGVKSGIFERYLFRDSEGVLNIVLSCCLCRSRSHGFNRGLAIETGHIPPAFQPARTVSGFMASFLASV